jgi:hypothetical protein
MNHFPRKEEVTFSVFVCRLVVYIVNAPEVSAFFPEYFRNDRVFFLPYDVDDVVTVFTDEL